MIEIDHIVYASPTLEQGIEEIEKLLGIIPTYGGKHLEFGTHNALVGLGKGKYFEIIATDPENKNAKQPRWMGVDLLEGQSRITRLGLKTSNIQAVSAALKRVNPNHGLIKTGMRERGDGSILQWKLTMTLGFPFIELLPFYIEWSGYVHPSEALNHPCRIKEVHIESQELSKLTAFYENVDCVTLGESPTKRIQVTIDSPNGIKIIF